MVMKIFVVDHFVLMFEIDKDRNLIVQLNDDNNIVEEHEYVEDMLLYHQQIKKKAKRKKKHYFLIKFNRLITKVKLAPGI